MSAASSDAVRPLDVGARPSERLLTQLASPRFKFLSDLEYAFQPIVNIHTGVCFGFEALLRRVDKAGFASVESFFDAMHAEGVMAEVDALLRQSAVGRFKGISCHERAKLFLNLDVRILEDAGQRRPFAHLASQLAALLETAGLHPGLLCLELNERQHLGTAQELKAAVTECRRYGFKLALDDFGTGLSGASARRSPRLCPRHRGAVQAGSRKFL